MMKRLGLKITCFVVSLVIWVQVASTSSVEQEIFLPLQVVGLAPGLTYDGSTLPAKVSVRVVGSKLRLLRHKFFHHFVGEVRVDLSGRSSGPEFRYDLKASDIYTNLTAATIYPPVSIRLWIDEVDSLRFSVVMKLDNKLPEDMGLLVPIDIVPDSVLVVGPHRFFEPLPQVATQGIDLAKISSSVERDVDLVVDRPFLKLSPEKVQVSVQVGVIQERTLANVPVIPLVDAGQPEVVVSPPVADVKVRGVADSVLAMTRDRLLVTIPVGNRPVGNYSLPGQVDYPPWLTLMGIVPPKFQVIVGDPPVLGPQAPESSQGEAHGE